MLAVNVKYSTSAVCTCTSDMMGRLRASQAHVPQDRDATVTHSITRHNTVQRTRTVQTVRLVVVHVLYMYSYLLSPDLRETT